RVVGPNVLAIAHPKDVDEHRARLESNAESSFAFAQPRFAGFQFRFGSFALGDVGDQSLNDLAAAPFNASERYFQWNLASLWRTAHPFKARAAARHAFFNVLTG